MKALLAALALPLGGCASLSDQDIIAIAGRHAGDAALGATRTCSVNRQPLIYFVSCQDPTPGVLDSGSYYTIDRVTRRVTHVAFDG